MTPKISIIIPVFNSEKYIEKCINSVLNQKYTYFELLLINDGSTDSSGAICNKYSYKDDRIKVFHKDNGGVSSARNYGLNRASGSWLTFIDSDDFIHINYLNTVFAKKYECPRDLIITNAIEYSLKADKYKLFKEGFLPTYSFLKLYGLVLLDTPWAKFYNLRIIKNNKINFDNSFNNGEDTLFNLDYIKHCQNIEILDISNYFYRDNPRGLSKYINSFEKELQLYQQIYEKYIKLTNLFGTFNGKINISRLLMAIYRNGYNRKDRIINLKKLKEYFPIDSEKIFNGKGLTSILLRTFLKLNTKIFDQVYFLIIRYK